MPEIFCFTLVGVTVLFLELLLAAWVIVALAHCFLLLVVVFFLLIVADLGIFALLVSAAGVPGFFFLTILLLQAGPYWTPAASVAAKPAVS